MSHKGKRAQGKNTTTGNHDGQIQSQAPMVSVVVVVLGRSAGLACGCALEGLLVAMALEGQLEPPQKRPCRGEKNTFAGLRPPVDTEALERHNDMINDYREALKDIHAETKRGPRKATTAATIKKPPERLWWRRHSV